MATHPTPDEALTALLRDSLVPLEAVLCTEALQRRPWRPPDYETENRALATLVPALADSPRTILQTLADTILEVFKADSAGISLLTKDDGGKRFYWPAIAGQWHPHIGGGTPRDFGPCGDVLDRNAALLFRHFERRYTYFLPITPPVEECLLVPFYVGGKAVGTIWAIAHDSRRTFDAEDLRQLESLGRFASAAYQAMESLEALEHQGDALRQSNAALVERMAELQQAKTEAQDARRAALNVMEDAVRTKEALRDSEARFRMLADNMAQLAWTCEQLGNVTWYNQRWLDYTGLPFADMQGWDWSKVQHPEHLERVVAGVKRAAETGAPWEDTFPLRGKDGTYRWFLSRAVPIRDDAGAIVCWFGTNTDITELRDAQQALRDADRRKDEFLALLAHELRNPLAPMRHAADILQLAGSDADAVQEMADVLERQVGHLARLVDDLLDVSRITRGTVTLRPERIALAAVIDQAVAATTPLVQSLGHDLTVTMPAQPLYLDADPVRLTQVVANLLHNACKFMDQGGHITLTVEREGPQAVIRVRDRGIGIAADQLPRIFEMFTQVETSLEQARGGLGLGLTLVKNLVELHEGTVEAHSAGVGQGSEFLVRLPILAEALLPRPPAPSDDTPVPTVPRRILVVDDNQDAVKSLARMLTRRGHVVHTAHDGLEAVEAAAAFHPDVVLLDIGLPGLNGYEAAQRMRAQPREHRLTLVALTGWDQEEDRRRSEAAGFDFHLVKPVRFAALAQILAEPSTS